MTISSGNSRLLNKIQSVEELRNTFTNITGWKANKASYFRNPFSFTGLCIAAGTSDTVETVLNPSTDGKLGIFVPHGKGVLKNSKGQVIYDGDWKNGNSSILILKHVSCAL